MIASNQYTMLDRPADPMLEKKEYFSVLRRAIIMGILTFGGMDMMDRAMSFSEHEDRESYKSYIRRARIQKIIHKPEFVGEKEKWSENYSSFIDNFNPKEYEPFKRDLEAQEGLIQPPDLSTFGDINILGESLDTLLPLNDLVELNEDGEMEFKENCMQNIRQHLRSEGIKFTNVVKKGGKKIWILRGNKQTGIHIVKTRDGEALTIGGNNIKRSKRFYRIMKLDRIDIKWNTQNGILSGDKIFSDYSNPKGPGTKDHVFT